MKARTIFSPYFILLFTLLVLALLEWLNIASASQTDPLQDSPGQVPFALQIVPADIGGWMNDHTELSTGQPGCLFPRVSLLAGWTYLPLTIYPLCLLLSGDG